MASKFDCQYNTFGYCKFADTCKKWACDGNVCENILWYSETSQRM